MLLLLFVCVPLSLSLSCIATFNKFFMVDQQTKGRFSTPSSLLFIKLLIHCYLQSSMHWDLHSLSYYYVVLYYY